MSKEKQETIQATFIVAMFPAVQTALRRCALNPAIDHDTKKVLELVASALNAGYVDYIRGPVKGGPVRG